MSDTPPETMPPDDAECVGVADIVGAFTALRHELKLQVRAGRELASGLEGVVDACLDRRLAGMADRLARLEPLLAGADRPIQAQVADAVRPLAGAIAEMEESLERAVVVIAAQADSLTDLAATDGPPPVPETDPAVPGPHERGAAAADWDARLGESPWVVRWIAGRLLRRLREVVEREFERTAAERERVAGRGQAAAGAAAAALADAGAGLELVLVRTRRLMEQAGIRRIDVSHQPFDADRMRAIDVTEDPAVPAGHVAIQYRPGYLLHGAVLRPAEVGVSR